MGVGGGPPSSRLLTSTAVLMPLRRTAEVAPLCLVVDDLPWLGRATAAVLGFVVRRLAGSRVGFLAAVLTGRPERRAHHLGEATAHPDGTLDPVGAAVRTGWHAEAAAHARAARDSAMPDLARGSAALESPACTRSSVPAGA